MAKSSGRWLRTFVLILLSISLLLAGIIAALQIPAVATWAGQRLLALVPLNPGYHLEVGEVSGSWLTNVTLHDVRLLHEERTLAEIERIDAEYDVRELLGSEIRIGSVFVENARVAARRHEGTWDIARAFGGTNDTTPGTARTFAIGRLGIGGMHLALEFGPDSLAQVRDITVRAEEVQLGDPLLLTLDTLHATAIPPGRHDFPLDVVARGTLAHDVLQLDSLRVRSRHSTVAGRAVIPLDFDNRADAGKLDLRLRASPLALADVAAFYPAVVSEGELWLDVTASSEANLATADVAARLNGSSLRLEAGTALGSAAPAVYRLSGELSNVDPSALLVDAPSGSLTGEVNAYLEGEPLERSSGTASLRLRDSEVQGSAIRSLSLAAEIQDGRAGITLSSNLALARANARGWVRPFDTIPSYQLGGAVWRIRGAQGVTQTLAGPEGNPDLSIRFSLRGRGISPEDARLSGRFDFAAVRSGGRRVDLGHTGIRLAEGRLRARPELQVADGRVSALLVATLGDTIRYELSNGSIDGVDLARLLNDTLAAPVSGQFQLRGRGITPENALATGRLHLDQLRYGERQLSEVSANATLRGGRVVLEMHGDLHDGTLALNGAARPFDTPLTFSLDSATLDRVDLGTFLDRPDLSGPVTLHATGRGSWSETTRAVQGKVVLEPSRFGNVDVRAAAVSAELMGERLTYDATVHTTGGSLALAGDGRPLDSIPSIRVQRGRLDSIDLGQLLGRPDLATALDARFTASATGTALDTMAAQLDLELLRSRVNDARLGPGEVDLSLAGGEVRGQVRLDGPDAHLRAALSGDLSGDVRRIGADGTLRLEELARWTGDSTRQGRLEGKFALEAAADSAGLASASGTVTAAGGMGRVQLQSFHAVVEHGNGALVFDTVMVRSNVAVLDGAGSLALRNVGAADTLRLTGRTGDLSALAELARIDSITLDSARFEIAVTGPPERRRISGDASAHRLLYAATLVEQLEAEASATLDSAGLGGVAGSLQLQGLAVGDITMRQAQLAGRYDSVVAMQGTADFGQDVRVALALEGTSEADTTRLRLHRLELDEGGRQWQLAHPAALALTAGSAEIDNFRLRSAGRQVMLNGVVAVRGKSDVTLRVDSLELGALRRVGLAPLPGQINGAVRLSGSAASPVMTGDLALTLHDGEEEDLGRIESALEWTRRGLQVNAVATPQQGGRLTVQGTLPWGFTLAPEDTTGTFAVVREPNDTLSLTVQADSFETALLRPFIPPEIAQNLRGELAADARIRGSPEAPLADGALRVTGLAFNVPELDLGYRRGRLSADLSGDVVRIDTLLLYTGRDQELAAQGEVRLQPLTNPELDLSGRLTDFMVSNSSELKAQASGQVQLTGTLETPVLTGSVRVGQAEYFATGRGGLAVEEVELTPEDRLEVARHFGPGVLARADDTGGFLDRFRINLDLRLPSQVWFRSLEPPELNVEVAGRIRLRQEPGGDMLFFGAVEPVAGRSTLDVYGRTFNLTGGEIILNGPVDETRIDVTAEYQVAIRGTAETEGVIVNVQATGQPDSIALEFSSEPEMPQDDMISYIVTGRPASDNPLVEGSGEGTGGGELALGQLTEAVSDVVGQELGFDVFQIRQEGTGGLMLTAGRYLTPDFYVSLRQPLDLSAQNDLTPGTNLGPGFELQYRMQPWLRLMLQGGSLPSGVLLRGRYAY